VSPADPENLSAIIDQPGKFLISNQDNLNALRRFRARPDGKALISVYDRQISQEIDGLQGMQPRAAHYRHTNPGDRILENWKSAA
jgi:hypothetical protein